MLSFVKSALNFYRIHFFFFVLIPLALSAILYAANGKYEIRFIDSLFICVSAATGTGLTTVDLSSLTAFQQAVLVVLEITGNQVFVSWVVVYFRRRYFLNHLEYIVAAEYERKLIRNDSTGNAPPSLRTIKQTLVQKTQTSTEQQNIPGIGIISPHVVPSKPKRDRPRIRPDMVRRVDVEPHLVDPTGRSARQMPYEASHTTAVQTVQHQRSHQSLHTPGERFPRISSRSTSVRTDRSLSPCSRVAEHEGDLGGFSEPTEVISRVVRATFPGLYRKMRRTVTMPRTETLIPQGEVAESNNSSISGAAHWKPVSYLSFRATVGRNSAFRGLTEEHIEDLGGIEYRALTTLLWVTPLYYFGLLAISFIVIAPYMAQPRWHHVFLPPLQHRKINSIWFCAFQVIGAWANTGMSLVDQNMTLFRTAYPMIIVLVLCVLAGNSLYPVFLRFMIWVLTKITPQQSRVNETLHFLLDHPRRCFIYLFPSSQTWLLFSIQMTINLVAFTFDLVLNLGNPATDSIPVGVRVINAVLAAAAVRSSGFQSISVSSLVPAVQVLDVILMYITIYPIALSVRSTNVYEERALGIYKNDADELEDHLDEKRWNAGHESRVAIWGKYILRHARKQLAFDMWWLALSLFLLCIIERTPLMDTSDVSWFNIWALIFELVSAYGTVGLSLGIPTANYSLSGALHTTSKLILCAVMIRGRHRGLPVTLDRAVLLPREFQRHEEATPDVVHYRRDQNVGFPGEKVGEGDMQESPVDAPFTGHIRTLSFAHDERKSMKETQFVDQIAESQCAEGGRAEV